MTAFVYTITGFIRRHNLGKTSEKVIGLEKGLQNSGITVKMEKVYEKYDFFKKRIWREKKNANTMRAKPIFLLLL